MRHPYHILSPSPWPILVSLNLLSFLISMVGILSGINNSLYINILSLISLLFVFFSWLSDIIIESNYIGNHSNSVSRSLIIGFLLFILTEIMLFFSLFWAYFHSASNPYYLVWPPIGIDLINPWSIPLLNTLLLLYSGIIATWAHHSFINLNRTNTLIGLILTISLGTLFFFLQLFEYSYSSFDITDSVYGSSFFITTGAHGLHVIVGTIFFIFTLKRIFSYHSSSLLFDITLLYWHFVDIVWIGLYILIYYMAYPIKIYLLSFTIFIHIIIYHIIIIFN